MSTGYDEISSNLITKCAEELATPLCHIINNSFKYGIFPDTLKLALVKPLHKKGDSTLQEKYRPISLIPTFSKMFEIAMASGLLSFFYSEKLLSSAQHGYLKGKSVETAVYDFIDRILSGFEDRKLSMGIFLDLSKAFDSLDHSIILEKLEHYGVRGPSLEWISSYLTNRRQRVVIQRDGERYFSSEGTLKLGIPQGSVLGPILFIFYVNNFASEVLVPKSHSVLFADDTNILVVGSTLPELLGITNEQLKKAQDWFSVNRLT